MLRVPPPNIAAPQPQGVDILRNPFLSQPAPPPTQQTAIQQGTTDEVDNEPKIGYKDPKGYKSGNYSKKHIEGIVKASKAIGIDPYQALALGLQESGFATAKERKGRGGFTIKPSLAQIKDIEPNQEAEVDELSKKSGIDSQYLKMAVVLRDKLKYAKQLGFNDEAAQLQAYNGYGTVTKRNFGGADKAYGVPIGEGINMKENPLYGKRLLELKQGFMANKEISDLIKSIK